MTGAAMWLLRWGGRSHWFRLVRLHGEHGARLSTAKTIARTQAWLVHGRPLWTLPLDDQAACMEVGASLVPQFLADLDLIPPADPWARP